AGGHTDTGESGNNIDHHERRTRQQYEERHGEQQHASGDYPAGVQVVGKEADHERHEHVDYIHRGQSSAGFSGRVAEVLNVNGDDTEYGVDDDSDYQVNNNNSPETESAYALLEGHAVYKLRGLVVFLALFLVEHGLDAYGFRLGAEENADEY